MKNNIEQQNKIVLFQSRKIRRAWHSDEWYFSLVDVLGALTDSSNPTDYLKKISGWTESLGQDLKIWLRIFLKESSNFVQKAQPSFTFCKIISFCPGALRLPMVFFRYDPGIFEIPSQRTVGNVEVPALKRRENKVFKNQSFFFRHWRKV